MKRVRPYPFDRLPRVARNQLEAGRVLRAHLPLGRGPNHGELERGLGGELRLQLVECFVTRAREVEPLLAGTVVRLGAGERWALAVMDPALAVAVAGAVLGFDATTPELRAPRPPTLVERGALELVVQLLVEHHPVQVVGVLDGDEVLALVGGMPDEELVDVLEARVVCPVGRGWARLVVPAALAQTIPRPRPRSAALERRSRLATAPVRAVLELARGPLDGARPADLTVGDVVAFATAAPDRGPLPARLTVARGSLTGVLDGERFTITAPYRLYEGATMADDPRDDSSTDQLLRELPVDVVCELGRLTLSGRELLELEPGAVVTVSRPLAGPVDLTVGGKLVARGELVDVEGDLGVRLTEVLG